MAFFQTTPPFPLDSITGLSGDSRTILPGELFFAIPGTKRNGEAFIPEALARDCAGIVAEKPCPAVPKNIPQWLVPDVRQALAEAARAFYGFPDEELKIYAVTGTNGKTTTAHLLQHLLSDERRAAYIGTLFYDTGQRKFPAPTTTPDAIRLQQLLRESADGGGQAAALELSSHALDQKRAYGLAVAAAIFTNLAEDHLEYHGDREAYFEAKSRLFDGRNGRIPPKIILNGDDPYGRRLRTAVSGLGAEVYTYGLGEASDVRAENLVLRETRAHFELSFRGEKWPVESPLPGPYNVLNVLAALTALLATDRFSEKTPKRLRNFGGVPGRTQLLSRRGGISVLVDYAHTADALAQVLGMLKPLCRRKLLLVFGCGGDRDRAKRPPMMGIAQDWADEIWVTSDNPRTEPQEQIFSDMRRGLHGSPEKIHWLADRRLAIARAVEAARSGDTLLVAGKGHENYQEIGRERLPFDDAEVLKAFLAQRFPAKDS
ncbi:MAG: UDP-N-acetylmuramoyl-L-alanyl-D-glutamate--2,6-diaminopimelate ligase [Puniceicoccales bacterium]|jgi:UDP-N-acetylmuramoyl-L-alanyl-D-glutamate--2,6-diaminopimelate ligase|nr:UDP-N-acetylmuramoyl-L-alanyl-D-glutamate--2,6-diaminopimelate ligase [Puniceicoccales bacterium]